MLVRVVSLVAGLAVLTYAGALGYLKFKERSFLFVPGERQVPPPSPQFALNEQRVSYPSTDGVTVAAWVIPAVPARASGMWMLICHGNFGSIGYGQRPEFYAGMRDLGINLLAFDYRGFGESNGAPEEQGLYDDAKASYDYLTRVRGIPPDRIVIFGHSLGSGVAIELASRVAAAALVVDGAYTSVVDRAQELYPVLPIRLVASQRFPSVERIGAIGIPKLFLHSPQDTVVPIAHGLRLFAAAREPKRFVEVKGGHENAFRIDGMVYYGAIAELLRQVTPGTAGARREEQIRAALPEVDRLFAAFAERSHVPGIAYGILIDGVLVHTNRVGFRELAGKSPIDDDTVFRIASMTKSFTALSILELRDEGKLSLDDPAERYVPELARLVYPTADSPRITIRHLLSHSEGFPEDNPWGDQQLSVTETQFTEMLNGGIPFSNAPGVAYEYSNYGFAILGRIVTRVSGVKYADYVRANILKPLGMTATTLEPASVPASRLAHGYRWEDNQWKEEPPLPDGAFGAMGGLLTSTRDLGRYVGFLMSAWPPRDEADLGPVKRSSLREMQQVARPRPATVTGGAIDTPVRLNALAYGYGLGIRQTCEFRSIVSHSGGLPGFGSQMRWLPDEGVGLIAMGNLTYTAWGAILDQVTDVLAKTGALTRRLPQPSAALLAAKDDVSRLVVAWDDALADRIAAGNLFLDESKDRRRRQFDTLRSTSGPCRADGPFEVENALRGQWTMQCERGALRVAITLAPTMPPKVQFLSVQPAAPKPAAGSRGCGQ